MTGRAGVDERMTQVQSVGIGTHMIGCDATELIQTLAEDPSTIEYLRAVAAELVTLREQREALREEKQTAVGSAAANSRLLDEARAELVTLKDALERKEQQLEALRRYRETQEGLPPGTLSAAAREALGRQT